MLPVTVSPFINLSCAEIYKQPSLNFSTRTVAVAFEVVPVIVSPTSNLPKDDVSKITLSPASSCVFCEDIFPESNNNTFVNPVSLSSCIPSDDSTLVTESFALSINV